MSVTKYIREYMATYYDTGSQNISLLVPVTYENQKTFSHIPTRSELEVLFDSSFDSIDISNVFEDCLNMIASPKLPPASEITDGSQYNGISDTFKNAAALTIPPKLPAIGYGYYAFEGCSSLIQAPVIQNGATFYRYCFRYCTSLAAPASIPYTMRSFSSFYEGCTAMAGEMTVRTTPSSQSAYANALKDTAGQIIIYGDKSVCEAIAATANNGNASWQPWYQPEPAVTDRGQGSFTTAADMTRMVRNGALAVSTYAPGRMVYRPGDIVREDEWDALVAAAQTIDPTVTKSTVYTNLNKIEAAFDSAL